MPTSISDPNGLSLVQANVISAALSAVAVGSTHYLLRDGAYTVWATAPFYIFMTDAAHDPIAIPAAQLAAGVAWPGILVATNERAKFQKDSTLPVILPGPITIAATGVRLVQLTGAAGTFYLTQLMRRVA